MREWWRWYRRHVRITLSAAWQYLKDGQEWRFDMRVGLSLFSRNAWLAHRRVAIQIGEALTPVIHKAAQQLTELNDQLVAARDTSERGG